MSKRLPLCAHCGATLVRRARCVAEVRSQPGRPLVGWHLDGDAEADCARQDPLCLALLHCTVDAAVALEEIGHRGPGRLVGGRPPNIQ